MPCRGLVTLVFTVTLATPIAQAEGIPSAERRSGTEHLQPETRAMQDDDTSNPGMLWVLEGQALWRARTGTADKACADCHGDASRSMAGVAARYPALDARTNSALSLEGRINDCRSARQKTTPWAYESRELLSLAVYVARQSRGQTISIDHTAMAAAIDQGRGIFMRRQGKLNLSCAGCHNDSWGRKLGGSTIPQGHPTGYPGYRLEWQSLGSLQRRLRNCLTGMRAESYDYGSPELVALEAYLMSRAGGLAMESPGVRP